MIVVDWIYNMRSWIKLNLKKKKEVPVKNPKDEEKIEEVHEEIKEVRAETELDETKLEADSIIDVEVSEKKNTEAMINDTKYAKGLKRT